MSWSSREVHYKHVWGGLAALALCLWLICQWQFISVYLTGLCKNDCMYSCELTAVLVPVTAQTKLFDDSRTRGFIQNIPDWRCKNHKTIGRHHHRSSSFLQSVGLFWTSDQLVAETSTWQRKTHNSQTSMYSVGFEPTIAAGERP
jgi:hypothetical protein